MSSLLQQYLKKSTTDAISFEELEVALEQSQESLEAMQVLGNQYHALVSGYSRLTAVGLEDASETVVMVSVESVLSDFSNVGIALEGIGFESFVETAQTESLEIALEGILSTIGDKIRKIGVTVRDFFTNQAKITGKIEEQASDIRSILEQGDGKTDSTKVTITRAHQLHFEGKTDKASIFKGIEAMHDVLDAMLNKYPQAYHNFVSIYVKNYIKSSWFTPDFFNQADAVMKSFDDVDALMEKELSVFGKKTYEFAGGLTLTTDMGPYRGRPTVKLADKRKKVMAKQKVDILTVAEIERMLQACEKIADLIDHGQRGFILAVRETERTLEKTNKEMKGYDAGMVKKWMAKFNGRLVGYMNYFDFVTVPTFFFVRHCVGTARAGLNYAEVSAKEYM